MSTPVSLDMIKKLREITAVGMTDCKKALELSGGDLEKAIEHLRKRGLSVAAKRSSNITDNGIIAGEVSADYHRAALIEVNCETDFSARTDSVKDFASAVVGDLVNFGKNAMEIDTLLGHTVHKTALTVQTMLTDLIAKISENTVISRVSVSNTSPNHLVNVYIHPDLTIGTLVELEADKPFSGDARVQVAECAKNVCMQVAAASPLYLDQASVPADVKQKEREIAREAMGKVDKPEAMLAKILDGKLQKFFKEVCLQDQAYIRDDSKSVGQYVDEVGKKHGLSLKLKSFARFAIKR